MRKNETSIATESIPLPPPEPKTHEPKPRQIHMVACKTVGEYN